VKTDASWPGLVQARVRVLGMQAKLHRWSNGDATARFDDLFNLVVDPAFLVMAWERVAHNAGARSAGVDGLTARAIEAESVPDFLAGLREQVKSGQFAPSPVREKLIPKSPGSYRRLGIPTIADRVVQACLVLVLEPIFEADFHPSSYGFRPRRRAWDAIAEIQMFSSRSYEWVLEGDIKACFDEIDHTALMGRVRARIGDKRVLALVKAFLKAGILSEDQVHRSSNTGTPQGGILSPLLANIALEVLDEHFAQVWASISLTRVDRSRPLMPTAGLCRVRVERPCCYMTFAPAGRHNPVNRVVVYRLSRNAGMPSGGSVPVPNTNSINHLHVSSSV